MQIVNFIFYKNLSKQISNVNVGEIIDTCNKYVVIIALLQLLLCGWLNFILKSIENEKTSQNQFLCLILEILIHFCLSWKLEVQGTRCSMIILILFLNVGERPPGSKEQFLLFGGAVAGNSEVLSNFFKILKMSSSWRVAFLKLQHTVEFIKLKLNQLSFQTT